VSVAQTFYAQITSRIMVGVVLAAGSLETCCCVGGRWANQEDEPCPHAASQDALLSSSMGRIFLVSWSMSGSFANSSSRSTSNRSTLPSCKSCAWSMCLSSIIRASVSPKQTSYSRPNCFLKRSSSLTIRVCAILRLLRGENRRCLANWFL
jgi:hypothetical protein